MPKTFISRKLQTAINSEQDRKTLPKFLTSSMTILARNSVAFPLACSILKSTLEISSCIKKIMDGAISDEMKTCLGERQLLTNLLLDADHRLQGFANCHVVTI